MSYQSIPADEDFDGGDFLARLRANSRPKTSTLNKAAPQPSQQFVSRLSPVVVPKSPQLSEVSVDPFEDAPDVSSAPLRLSPPTLPTGWQANSRESEATKRTRRQPPVVNVQYVPCLPFPAAAPAPTAWMAPHYAAFPSPIVSSNATGCAPSLGWSPVYGRNVVQPVAVPTAAAIPARIVQSVPKVAHAGTLGAQKPVDKIQERMDKVSNCIVCSMDCVLLCPTSCMLPWWSLFSKFACSKGYLQRLVLKEYTVEELKNLSMHKNEPPMS